MTYRTIRRHLPADRNFKYSHIKNILQVRCVEVMKVGVHRRTEMKQIV